MAAAALIRFTDSIFLSRPVLWIPVWSFSALGYWRARMTSGWGIPLLWTWQDVAMFGWIFVFSAAVGAVYALNQIADQDTDQQNEGFALLAQGRLGKGRAWATASVLALSAIAIPAFSHPMISFFAIAAVLTGIVYSFRPFYCSGRPILDFVTNAFGYGILAFGLGWYVAGRPILSMHFLSASGPYFFLMCAGSISSTLPDMYGDRATNKKTTAVVLGARNAHVLATSFLGLAAFLAVADGDAIALICALCSLPLYVAYMVHSSPRLMEATYKVGGGMVALLSTVLCPVLIVPSVVVLGGTVVYFRLRHGVLYPSLLPAHEHDRP